jgi:exopolyphosphatase/pppGpp-phosphohydrolase
MFIVPDGTFTWQETCVRMLLFRSWAVGGYNRWWQRTGLLSASEEARHVASVTLAALDVGSNSIHLTVARLAPDLSDLMRLADEVDLARLGADVSTTGVIGPERMARAAAAIQQQAELAHRLGAQVVLGIATEGVRAAANGLELVERVRAETGVALELMSGKQEAALTYWGATSGLKQTGKRRAVLDMGGGSLELAVGKKRRVTWRDSLRLGSVTMHHRYAPSDPPTVQEMAAVRQVVAETLAPLDPPLPVSEAIVCGGTVSALTALANRLAPDTNLPKSPGRARYLTSAQLEAALGLLETLPADEVSRRYDVDEGRARLLPSGGAVLLAAMARLDVGVLRSRRRGIREGAMLTYARTGGRWLAAAKRGDLNV